ncbi:MAG: hypothetical protein ACI3ZY_11515 [Parabacteroides sp.]
MDGKDTAVNSLLEDATAYLRRCQATAGEAGSAENSQRDQLDCLKDFASEREAWIDLSSLSLSFLSKGGENEVYYYGNQYVVKLNNLAYAGDDPLNFFTRIKAHNRYFYNIPYQMVGFAYNQEGEFCVVLLQDYVRAEREATPNEIQSYMENIGFITDYLDEYHNDEYEIFDAVPNNVLYGIDGQLYFIDTQIRSRR